MAGDNRLEEALASMMAHKRIFPLIIAERVRQEQLKLDGKFLYTCADSQMLSADKYVVLGEEFGEVGRAILNLQGHATDYNGSLEILQGELIQLAAVTVAWLEFIDSVSGQTYRVENPLANKAPA